MINDATNATVNPAAKTTVEVFTPDYIANNDPLAFQAANMVNRTNQQQVIPNAIQDRFINTLKQWPVPGNQSAILTTDMGKTTALIGDGIGSNPPPTVSFFFVFTNTIAQLTTVELATSIFVDDTTIYNAYPFGATIHPLDWVVERTKTAHHLTQANTVYSPNQANQVSESLIIKYYGSGSHRLYVNYYWRYSSNQGGSKT